jgi:RNA polymerase sigma factor (sigma-70 family)
MDDMNAPRNLSPLEQVRRRQRVGIAASTPVKGEAAKPVRKRLSSDDERLLNQIMSGEQDFIDSPAFYESGAEKKIYEEAPDVPKPDTTWYHPVMDDLSSTSRSRTVKSAQQVILTGAQEKILFHQFNYARYRVWKIQEDVNASPNRQPTVEQAEEILRWYRLSDRIREQIAETNLALVLAMAKRTRMSEVDFADLVSEGNMALLRAVDKFDAGRGYKFSTYACRAILKAFSRQGMKLSKYRQRFPTDFDPKLERSNFLETKRAGFEKDAAEEVKRIVLENRADLSDVERTVIEHRFGLESGELEKPMTLEQVGQIIGVTKERVRQIQNKAMEKIKLELEASFMGIKPDEPAGAEGGAADPNLVSGAAPNQAQVLSMN